VRDDLEEIKLHTAFERKLKERIATGPVYNFRPMLDELPVSSGKQNT
jgi:hypothetical protein